MSAWEALGLSLAVTASVVVLALLFTAGIVWLSDNFEPDRMGILRRRR